MTNRQAFDSLELEDVPAVLVRLGRSLADELDRQFDDKEGVNAALVQRYQETVSTIRVLIGGADDGDNGEEGDPLAGIVPDNVRKIAQGKKASNE